MEIHKTYKTIDQFQYYHFSRKYLRKYLLITLWIFLDTNDILYDKQFGFRKTHSTSHAIITLVDKVSRALDTGKFIVGVFLDLKKAFDTVGPHNLIKETACIRNKRQPFRLVQKLFKQ